MAQPSTTEASKKIVLLGGSYGGIITSHYILKHVIPKLPTPASYEVILVSPSTKVMCRPACPRALISDDMFPQEKLFVEIAKNFTQYPKGGFRFIHGKATSLNHVDRQATITLNDNKTELINFHALVIATGASTSSPLFGLNKDDEFLRQNWVEFRKALPAAKSILIVGGGPTSIETAGELGEYLNGRAGWLSSELVNPKVSITVVTSDSKILPHLRLSLALKAEKLLAQVGVDVMKNSRVKSVEPSDAGTINVGSKAVVTLENGTTMETDLYIPATGTKPNTSFIDKSLLTSDGRVEADGSTMRVEKAGPLIYAIGDVSSGARPAIHTIFSQAPILGANIKRDLLIAAGKEESSVRAYKVFEEERREMQLVPIGPSKGVGAAMGWQIPSFLVWLIKGRDFWLSQQANLWNGKSVSKE